MRFLVLPLCALTIAAQESRLVVAGRVVDHDTKEGLAGVNIHIIGTSRGATTNSAGHYSLFIELGAQISFGHIGNWSDTVHVESNSDTVRIDVFLRPNPLTMADITVVDEDPAVAIVREAIRSKRKYMRSLHRFEAVAQNRTVLRIARSKKDSAGVTQRDTVIGGILETRSNLYWQSPDRFKEIITARHQTANFLDVQNMFAVGEWINLNDDNIHIDQFTIPGPTSPDALTAYDVVLEDVTAMDGRSIYKIRYRPKQSWRPLMDGIVGIADSSFAVVFADVRISDALDGTVQNLALLQEFSRQDSFWMPRRLETRFVLKIDFPGYPRIFVQSTSAIHQYNMNGPDLSAQFDGASMEVRIATDTDPWLVHQVSPLTPSEEFAYRRIDSLMKRPFQRTLSFVLYGPIRLAKTVHDSPITGLSDLYRFNRVDGHTIGIGVSTKDRIQTFRVRGWIAYGEASRRWSFESLLEKDFGARRTFGIVGRQFRKLDWIENPYFYSTNDVTFGALMYHRDYRDYYRNEGWEGGFRWRPLAAAELTAAFRDERHTSETERTNFSIFSSHRIFRPNAPVDAGRIRSFALHASYDTRQFRDFGWVRIPTIGTNNWFVEANVELVRAMWIQSDFDYRRYVILIQRHQLTLASFYSDFLVQAGWISGSRIPLQKAFWPEGRLGGSSAFGTLRTVRNNEFAGTRMASLWSEHHWGNSLFKLLRLPYFKTSSLDLILIYGMLATSGRQTTTPLAASTTGWQPVHEFGIGIGHQFFRLDFAWRRPNKTFSIQWSSQLF